MRVRKRFALAAILCGVLFWLLASPPASAQTARLEAVARALRQNARELVNCRWKSRTEIALEGEVLQVSLTRVSYDESGGWIETPLPDPDGSPRSSARLKKKVRQFHEELRAVTRSYFELDPRRMEEALRGAHAWEGRGEDGNRLRVQARSVIRQGDKLDLWLDGATLRPLSLEVLTSLRGEPVLMRTDFAQPEAGPSYAARIVVETELKERKMTVRTENFDFARRDGAPAEGAVE